MTTLPHYGSNRACPSGAAVCPDWENPASFNWSSWQPFWNEFPLHVAPKCSRRSRSNLAGTVPELPVAQPKLNKKNCNIEVIIQSSCTHAWEPIKLGKRRWQTNDSVCCVIREFFKKEPRHHKTHIWTSFDPIIKHPAREVTKTYLNKQIHFQNWFWLVLMWRQGTYGLICIH